MRLPALAVLAASAPPQRQKRVHGKTTPHQPRLVFAGWLHLCRLEPPPLHALVNDQFWDQSVIIVAKCFLQPQPKNLGEFGRLVLYAVYLASWFIIQN